MTQPEQLPLSFAQYGMWQEFRRDGPGFIRNMPLALRIRGALDREALRLAVDDVVLRHEPLRTKFPQENGVPYQSVFRGLPAEVRMRDIRCREQEVSGLLAAEYHYAFDLNTEIPVRVRLLTVAEDNHVLSFLTHHIASDGWSLRVLCDDLGTAYAARHRGSPPDWAPLEIDYRDYTYWQRELVGDENDPASLAHEQLAYWDAVLADLPEELALPFDRPRPESSAHCGAPVEARLDPEVHARLLDLAQSTGATLFVAVHAAVCVLLSRHGAGTDIPIASVVAGRDESALEPMFGIFINTVILRADLSGNPTFRELLDRIRTTDLAAYDHADLPFDRVQEYLARTHGRPFATQTFIAFETGGVEELELDGLTVRPEPVTQSGAKRDLTFHFLDTYGPDGAPAGIDGALEYDSELFDADTARMFTADLRRLLETVTENPDIPIGTLNPISAEEGATA